MKSLKTGKSVNFDENAVKAYLLDIKEISYRRSDLLDGPLFISSKNEVKKIKYNNGVIDSFAIVKEAITPQVVKNTISAYLMQNYTNEIQTTFRKGIYLYQSQQISDRKVLYLALNKNQIWKNSEIDYFANQYRKNKVLQCSIGIGGAVVGGISMGYRYQPVNKHFNFRTGIETILGKRIDKESVFAITAHMSFGYTF